MTYQKMTAFPRLCLLTQTSSSAMADKLCDCLRPKRLLCSYQHCHYTSGKNNATEALSAECIWNTGYTYNQFRMGWSTFGEYFTGKGRRPPTNVSVTKL